ncbi:putative ORfan [Saudi moumouvirus]|nr:putative ORfan [Saudi moumouvirus]
MNSCWGPTFECYNKSATNNNHTVHVHHHHHHYQHNHPPITPGFSISSARVNPSGSGYYNPGIPALPSHKVIIVTPGFTEVSFIPVVQRTNPW